MRGNLDSRSDDSKMVGPGGSEDTVHRDGESVGELEAESDPAVSAGLRSTPQTQRGLASGVVQQLGQVTSALSCLVPKTWRPGE